MEPVLLFLHLGFLSGLWSAHLQAPGYKCKLRLPWSLLYFIGAKGEIYLQDLGSFGLGFLTYPLLEKTQLFWGFLPALKENNQIKKKYSAKQGSNLSLVWVCFK